MCFRFFEVIKLSVNFQRLSRFGLGPVFLTGSSPVVESLSLIVIMGIKKIIEVAKCCFILAVKVMDKNVNGALVFVRSVWTEFLILLEGKITLFEIVLLNLVRRLKVDAVDRMLGVKSFFLYHLLMAKKSLEACWTGFCASALNLKSEVVEYLRIREILESVRTPIESLMGYSLGFGVGLLGVAIFYEDGPERVLNLYYSIFGGPK